MFFVGFLAFLIRWAFYWSEWGKAEHMPMFYTHAIVTVVLGAFAVRLCRHCTYSLTKLRVAELVIFGCPALYFLAHALDVNTYLAKLPAGEARIETIVTPWLLLIFTYAMFIPNTWQRAAAVLAAICAVPIGILVYMESAEIFQPLLSQQQLQRLYQRSGADHCDFNPDRASSAYTRSAHCGAKRLPRSSWASIGSKSGLAPAVWARCTWPSIK